MEEFSAYVSWPSAPLTNRLVLDAVNSLTPTPRIVDTLSQDLLVAPGRLLQWATYDALDHGLTFSHDHSTVLSSSYIIRKALIRKHFLSRCIHNYLTKHPKSILAQSVPKTWELELSFADELDELWGDDLYDLSDEIEKEDPSSWWILKPGMADRGMGLRLFHTKTDLARIFQEFEQNSDSEPEDEKAAPEGNRDTAVITSQLRHFVIQEYLANPLLLDPTEVPLDGGPKPAANALHGHKFHLRVYCVAFGAIKVYMYERILALFSSVPYSPPSKLSDDADIDLAAHLTNTALQQERGQAGVRLLDELVGLHILSSTQQMPARHSQRPPRAMGRIMDPETLRAERRQQAAQAQQPQYPTLTVEDIEDLKEQIGEVVSETFKAAMDMSVHFQPLPNAFELYGTDFVVTQNPTGITEKKFQVKLLEINSEPAIELTGPRLTWILEDLFKGIAKTCVEPFFGKDGPAQLKVGEAKEHLRLCLDMQIRGSQGW